MRGADNPGAVRGILLGVMLSSSWFAGCMSPSGETSSGGPQRAVTEDTGAITGIVISDTLLPLANVAITLDGASGSAFTAEDGRFLISPLLPGTHTLGFFRDDFRESNRSVDVEAGSVSEIQVELLPRPSQEPFVRLDHDTGFIGCTLTMRDPVVSPDGRGKAALCTILAEYGGASTLDNSYIPYAPESFDGIGDFLGEASWVSTQTLGRGLFINYWLYHPDVHPTINDAWDVDWTAGPNPLQLRVPIERIQEVMEENSAPGTECADRCNLFVLLYSYPQTATSAPVDVGLAVDQRFEMYRSTSFHARLPPEYTALPDA